MAWTPFFRSTFLLLHTTPQELWRVRTKPGRPCWNTAIPFSIILGWHWFELQGYIWSDRLSSYDPCRVGACMSAQTMGWSRLRIVLGSERRVLKMSKTSFLNFAYQNKQLAKKGQDFEPFLSSSWHSIVNNNSRNLVEKDLAAVC